MLIEKIKAHVESLPENLSPEKEIRMSLAGDCPRKLEYDALRGASPVDFKQAIRMLSGHHLHDMMRSLVAAAFGDDVHLVETEVEVMTPKGRRVPGHPDGAIKSLDAVFEFKSVSDVTFQMIENQGQPLPQHLVQANLYAMAIGSEWVLIVYMSRDFEFKEFMFEFDPILAQMTLDRLDRVIDNRESKTLSTRPHNDKTQSPCWYCPHKDPCYEGFESQVSGFRIEEIQDPEIIDLAVHAQKHRATRLAAEKLEGAAREVLGKKLFPLGIKKAQIKEPKLSIELSVGKNQNLITTVKEMK